MKIGEILATNYVHPDIEKNLKKVEKRAKGSARMGYHSSMAYPFRVKEDKHGKADFKLTNGEYKILQADDDKMTRGLAIRSNKDGSYDSYYWYEDPSKPISDEAISKIISKEGIRVARRTVAKYREIDGMPSSSQRRRRQKMDALCG